MEKLAQRLVGKFVQKFDPVILDIVVKFIRERRLIIYGGTAINAILPPSKKFYNPSVDNPDYDVLSWNNEQDAMDLVTVLRDNGFTHLRIITGLGGNARRVFVGFSGDSICDFGQLTEAKFRRVQPTIEIDGFIYPSVQFLKIDMYRHFVTGLFADYSRIEKVQKRIQLLNSEFPFPDGPVPMVGVSTPPERELQEKYFDLVLGGPYVYHHYMEGKARGEPFFLSNKWHSEFPVAEDASIAMKLERWSVPLQETDGILLGYKGEIFYVMDPVLGRILSKVGLLYYFLLLNDDGKYTHYIHELSRLGDDLNELNVMISHISHGNLKLPGTVYIE